MCNKRRLFLRYFSCPDGAFASFVDLTISLTAHVAVSYWGFDSDIDLVSIIYLIYLDSAE